MSKLVPVADLAAATVKGSAFDAVVVVSSNLAGVGLAPLAAAIAGHRAVDATADATVSLVAAAEMAGGRLVLAPTGPIDRDQDDVRRFAEAAAAGIQRARDAGAVRPLVVLHGVPATDPLYANAAPVTALAALGALWQPLEAHDALGAAVEPVQEVGFGVVGDAFGASGADWANAVEAGLRVARDLCGTEPERMAPPRFADYCVAAFAGQPVEVEVVADGATIERDYPLAAAVARSSMQVERHRPRIVRLEYEGAGPITRTILLAGKGICYDTGGADLKTGGGMAGMSRDKGGAAAVAGFVRAVAGLQPKGVRVVAEIGCVRNSVGANAYVADEIITSHAGVRVRVGNTDAEGRMVLADLLSHLRVRAADCEGPLLFSVATLTGHAVRAAGPYNIALDNAPARDAGVAVSLGGQGDLWGDPFEVSRLRREDWDFVKPRSAADDVMQCNNAPSTMTNRGHQFPMAFLAVAAGLDKHGRGADSPLPFTHLDIGGSACEGSDWQHGRPTGRPVVGMLAALVEGGLPA
ncbi:MAG: leucyl aminopeptidase family protein [bacterium]|nr:leucyl aminopeptidase family protein [bacterium]